MLVLEDMHWADRSTQDFVVALSRTGRGPLLLVLTVRDDDLHRRHPARRTLAEISRVPGARRIDLDPLGRDGITGIVAASSGGAPDGSLVRSVLARSEGNPLYAEELLAAGARNVPGHLADLFLARVDAVSDGSRELLRVASVDGTRVDTDTIAELAVSTKRSSTPSSASCSTRTSCAVRATSWRSGTGCCARPYTTTCSPTNARGSTETSPPSSRLGSTRTRILVCRC